MALTEIIYTGIGSYAGPYTVPFPYVTQSTVHVYLNDVETTAFTWVTSGTIVFTTAPGDGVKIKIKRITPVDERLIDFANGATLTAENLDTDSLQLFYNMQELQVTVEENLGAALVVKETADQVAALAETIDANNAATINAVTAQANNAAASAAAANTFNPANFYPKTAFKNDGTGSAPILYNSDGSATVKYALNVMGPAGSGRALSFYTNLSARWNVFATSAAEAGSNTGSDLGIGRFNDAGTWLSNPVVINRASGIVTFESSPLAPTPTAGDNSTKLATTAFIQSIVAGLGSFLGAQFVTASGTYTKTPGTKKTLEFIQGAGAQGNYVSSTGTGGGQGGLVINVRDVSAISTLAATIGAGGGATGGSTVFGGCTAGGGVSTQTAGVASSGGLINIPGGTMAGEGAGTAGNDSLFGRGGAANNPAGMNASGYGAGGGWRTGVAGSGSAGCILILEFA